MPDRGLLARGMLGDFKQWLVEHGWTIEPPETLAEYQVLRARRKGRKRPLIVWTRNRGLHYSIEWKDHGVVRAFVDDRGVAS